MISGTIIPFEIGEEIKYAMKIVDTSYSFVLRVSPQFPRLPSTTTLNAPIFRQSIFSLHKT